MLRIRTFAVATGLAVALSTLATTSTSRAQGPGGMPGMGMMMGGGGQNSPITILLAPSVQKELKLTEPQKINIYNLSRTTNQKHRDLNQTMMIGGNMNPQVMREAGMRLRQETDRSIAQILEPKQKERLDQIVLQAEGPLAVARPEVAAKLGLKEIQRQSVQQVMVQMNQEIFMTIRQARMSGQFNPAEFRLYTAKLRKSAEKEVGKYIDAKQKKNFNKLIGDPFDITKLNAETELAETAAPPVTAAAPAAEPTKPAETAPATDPAKPADTAPAADPAKPAADPAKPAADPAKPAADPAKPADTPPVKVP